MFTSLKHWLEMLDKDSQLFEHADSEVIHVALASYSTTLLVLITWRIAVK